LIWHTVPHLATLARAHENSAVATLGIAFTAVGDDFLEGCMPVDGRTVQPMGILHGGASVLLAETLGSCAASHCVDPARELCVGLDINANHLRAVRSGAVTGRATPLHLGRSTQVWSIDIRDDQDRRVCIARLTMAVIAKERAP
jgi:1,4-dihydroxy-2-naphthoyl-CoA hydrolase